MSIEDEMAAQRALFHYLTEWGVDDAAKKAQKFIDELLARGWRMAPMYESRPQPPKRGQECHGCQRHQDRCICQQPVTRPIERVPANETWAEERARLRDRLTPTPAAATEETP